MTSSESIKPSGQRQPTLLSMASSLFSLHFIKGAPSSQEATRPQRGVTAGFRRRQEGTGGGKKSLYLSSKQSGDSISQGTCNHVTPHPIFSGTRTKVLPLLFFSQLIWKGGRRRCSQMLRHIQKGKKEGVDHSPALFWWTLTTNRFVWRRGMTDGRP